MNKYFSKVTSLFLAGAMVLAAGCTDYKEDINNLRDELQGSLDQKALALTEQIDALEATQAALEKALDEAQAEAEKNHATKKELQDAKTAIEAAIKSGDDALKAKIDGLTTTVGNLSDDLGEFKKAATDKLNEINEALKNNATDIQTVKSDLAKLQAAFDGKIAEIESRIKAAEEAIRVINEETIPELGYQVGMIDALITSLQQVNNDQDIRLEALESYKKTTAETLELLQGAIQRLEATSATKKELATLEAQFTEAIKKFVTFDVFETEINALKANLEAQLKTITELANNKLEIEDFEVYRGLIANQLNEIETTLEQHSEDIEALKVASAEAVTSITNISGRIDALVEYGAALEEKFQDAIDEAAAKIAALELKAEKIKIAIDSLDLRLAAVEQDVIALLNRIQSIVYVPEYTDGCITANYAKYGETVIEGQMEVTYKVNPADAAEGLAAAWEEVLSYDVEAVKTRGAAPEFNIVGAKAVNGNIVLTVQPRNLGTEFYLTENVKGKTNYTVALQAANETANISSVYTNVIPASAENVLDLSLTIAKEVEGEMVVVAGETFKEELSYGKVNTPVALAPNHEPCFIGADENIYTVSQLVEAGYALPSIQQNLSYSYVYRDHQPVTDNHKKALAFSFTQEGAYNYVNVAIAQADKENVGLVYTQDYTYTVVKADGELDMVSVYGSLEITKEQYKVAMEDVTIYWDYRYHAGQDEKNGNYNIFTTYDLNPIDAQTNLPEDISYEDIFAKVPVQEFYGADGKLIRHKYSITPAVNEEKMPIIGKAWLSARTPEFDTWGQTVKAVLTYDLSEVAEIEVTFNVKFEDRPDEIKIEFDNVAEQTITKDLLIEHGDIAGDSISEAYAAMNKFTTLSEADYFEKIFRANAYEYEGRMYSTSDSKKSYTLSADDEINGIRISDKNLATIGFEPIEPVVALGTEVTYEVTFTTHFGQKIILVKKLALKNPSYHFQRHNYRVAQDGTTFYTDVQPLYTPSTESNAVSDFSVAKVEVAEAFNIVELKDGKCVDVANPADLGLEAEFSFVSKPKDKGITLENNVITYDGKDDAVKVNGKLYINLVNGGRYEIPNAFVCGNETYANNYEVRKYDPIGELKLVKEQNFTEVKDAVKYTVDMFTLFSLKDVRGYSLIDGNDWMNGDGSNGYAVGADVEELYGLEWSFAVKAKDPAYNDVLTFTEETGQLVFDNTDQLVLYHDLEITVTLTIKSKWGIKSCDATYIFKK